MSGRERLFFRFFWEERKGGSGQPCRMPLLVEPSVWPFKQIENRVDARPKVYFLNQIGREIQDLKPPPVDLGISFQYQTVYMQPLDELVLSALGYVLLNKEGFSDFERNAGNDQCFAMRSNVDHLHIIKLNRSLTRTETKLWDV